MPLSRKTLIAGAAAAELALHTRTGIATAAEERVNNVLIEDGRWLLPGWETLTDADDAGVNTTLDLVAQTAGLLASKNIGLLLVSIPFKARYCDALPASELSDAIKTRYSSSLAAMQSRGLKTVDLDAVFRPLQTPDQPLYYHTDQHWTSLACDAAGTAIAGAIRAHWTIPENGKREPLPPLIIEKRVGDLATLLPEKERAEVGLETYKVRTAYDADLKGYDMFTGAIPVADPSPLVQLVGSSFVRPMWGLPQKMANVLGRGVGLTFFNGDAGPYHTMLMNLRSTLPQRRPTVVVWQMTEANLHLGPAAKGWWSIADLMTADFFLSKVQESVKKGG